jgi:type VI secretion system protein
MARHSGVRLWTRLKNGGAGADLNGTNNDLAVVESIRENISWILNTHRGDAPASPNYGMPDISVLIAGLPSTENEFCAGIEKCIKEHEPRVKRVRVKCMSGSEERGIRAHFVIELVIGTGTDISDRRIQATVNMDNVFTLK